MSLKKKFFYIFIIIWFLIGFSIWFVFVKEKYDFLVKQRSIYDLCEGKPFNTPYTNTEFYYAYQCGLYSKIPGIAWDKKVRPESYVGNPDTIPAITSDRYTRLGIDQPSITTIKYGIKTSWMIILGPLNYLFMLMAFANH